MFGCDTTQHTVAGSHAPRPASTLAYNAIFDSTRSRPGSSMSMGEEPDFASQIAFPAGRDSILLPQPVGDRSMARRKSWAGRGSKSQRKPSSQQSGSYGGSVLRKSFVPGDRVPILDDLEGAQGFLTRTVCWDGPADYLCKHPLPASPRYV